MRTNRQTYSSLQKCVLGMVLVLSFSALVAGGLIWLNEGFSNRTMVLIVSGGITVSLIIVGTILDQVTSSSSSREPSSSPAVTQTQDDAPPTYRNTWRLEYIEKIPASLKLKLQSTRTEKHSSKRDVRTVWTSTEVGVHGDTSTPEYVYTTNEMTQEGHSSIRIFLPDGRYSPAFQPSQETGSSETPERTSTLPVNLHNVQPFSPHDSNSGSISVIPSGATGTIHQSFDDGLPSGPIY